MIFMSPYLEKYCKQQIFELLKEEDCLLINAFSMTWYALSFLSEEIRVNNRMKIIEFGSGISTIVMAREIERHNLNAKITSVEHDTFYFNRLKTFIRSEKLDHIINLVQVPLEPDTRLGGNNKWYDAAILNGFLGNVSNYDMVVIDGPPAYKEDFSLSRYGGIPFIFPRLADGYSIFLDDANRSGEKKVLEFWKKEFNLDFTIHNFLAVNRTGQYVNIYPNLISKDALAKSPLLPS